MSTGAPGLTRRLTDYLDTDLPPRDWTAAFDAAVVAAVCCGRDLMAEQDPRVRVAAVEAILGLKATTLRHGRPIFPDPDMPKLGPLPGMGYGAEEEGLSSVAG